MKEVKAPNFYSNKQRTIFLAGSIEMGNAEEWQTQVVKGLGKSQNHVTILNPRRDDWDSSWKQEITDEKFYEQVSWELQSIENADVVLFYFAPGTQSPISLLELGYCIGYGKEIVVVCPDGFWRKGNVDIILDRNPDNVMQFDTLKDAVSYLKGRF